MPHTRRREHQAGGHASEHISGRHSSSGQSSGNSIGMEGRAHPHHAKTAEHERLVMASSAKTEAEAAAEAMAVKQLGVLDENDERYLKAAEKAEELRRATVLLGAKPAGKRPNNAIKLHKPYQVEQQEERHREMEREYAHAEQVAASLGGASKVRDLGLDVPSAPAPGLRASQAATDPSSRIPLRGPQHLMHIEEEIQANPNHRKGLLPGDAAIAQQSSLPQSLPPAMSAGHRRALELQKQQRDEATMQKQQTQGLSSAESEDWQRSAEQRTTGK
jgi:hypothetical protein